MSRARTDHCRRRARQRELDLAVAACALANAAALWTLNVGDFRNIPGFALVGVP